MPSLTAKPSASNANSVGAGAILGVLQVCTIGQPLEVLKTHLAAHRGDSLRSAILKTYQRGGIRGYYQGLFPWAVFEASTKGAILLVSSRQAEKAALSLMPGNAPLAGLVGGVVGGLTQAYAVMGVTTTMKTVEMTRAKDAGTRNVSTLTICRRILAAEGLGGLYKGVNAVALRQMTTWASRIGITRLNESVIRRTLGKSENSPLSVPQKIFSSCVGGAISCWNQPFEVLRIEMQSAAKDSVKRQGEKLSMLETATRIFRQDGIRGFYRGITPRIALGMSVTTFLVAGGDFFSGVS